MREKIKYVDEVNKHNLTKILLFIQSQSTRLFNK